MEVRKNDVGTHRFPFSELIINNEFVLADQEQVCKKTGRNSYCNLEGQEFQIDEDKLHSTKVQLR